MIPTSRNVKTISDMRENPKTLLRQVRETYGPLFILYHSQPQAVLLSLEAYQKLADLAEDYIDSLKAQEFEKEDKAKIKWLDYEEVKKIIG